MQVTAWTVLAPREPMVQQTREEVPGPGEAIVEVAGCGVCHTDLGFYYDGIPTRHPFPLTLGHEVSGRVVQAGEEGASGWVGKDVIVPAVLPCGDCDACRTGHGSICPQQIFPGNDVHGGFASHLRVPILGLCDVGNLDSTTHNPSAVNLPIRPLAAHIGREMISYSTAPSHAVDGRAVSQVDSGGIGALGSPTR